MMPSTGDQQTSNDITVVTLIDSLRTHRTTILLIPIPMEHQWSRSPYALRGVCQLAKIGQLVYEGELGTTHS